MQTRKRIQKVEQKENQPKQAAKVTKKINKDENKIKRTKTMEETMKEGKIYLEKQDKKGTKQTKAQLQKQQQDKIEKNSNKKNEIEEEKKESTQQQQQQKNNQKIIKRNSSFENNKFKLEDIPKFINLEHLREDMHELDEHRNFKEKFLGREGAFQAYKVLIGQFYPFDFAKAGGELTRRGFQFDIVKDLDSFMKNALEYDIIWIISSNGSLFTGNLFGNLDSNILDKKNEAFLNLIEQIMKAKKSLFLWADNFPFTKEPSLILKKFFNNMYLEGGYQGAQILNKSEDVIKGTFDQNHSIGYGLNNMYEGITISSAKNIHPDFKIFAKNTNDEPCVLYADENDQHGRILIDTGFTKLYHDWEKAGTHQYISNANVWLTGIPQ